MRSASEIRQQFIDFFVHKHGHTAVPSSPVVPLDDPTLLFTNAGMNQFKDVFLGTGSRPFQRAVDSQKCIRAGGKHNDLDDVGKDTYHHTFFEMLGNWSFGDYFKKEAIQWAWELLTGVWGLDKTRLHATVFEGSPDDGVPRDDEAFEYWKTLTDINPHHIHLGNKKDNFWEMGETGPCGPCTEIHYDKTPDRSGAKLVNKGTPDVIEIWNLVFIQFNRDETKKLTPLPAKHVDTGMGFERVTAVLQGKDSNYDTDVFTPIMDAIGKLVDRRYQGRINDMSDVSFRVIADHLRMATFAVTDGARPGNKKRDAVLRSVIRRAVRFGYQYFGVRKPFLCKLVPVIVDQMGNAFPELKQKPDRVAKVINEEETDFLKTIERGLRIFDGYVNHTKNFASGVPSATFIAEHPEDEQAEASTQIIPYAERDWYFNAGKNVIPGDAVFVLHTTHGFPPDLTMQMAQELGLSVDMERYAVLLKKHQEDSGGEDGPTISAIQGQLPKTDDSPKYDGLRNQAKVLGWVKDNSVTDKGGLGSADGNAALLLDRTCFYAEQGGQVGDSGTITTKTGAFEVEDTQKLGDGILHLGRVIKGTIEVGQPAELQVGGERPHTMRNHTATHLMNWALRKVLGDHIEQKGSLVDADKTRFDFTHNAPLTPREIDDIERLVNEKIYSDLPVQPITMPLSEAKKIAGVRAVFGEKYPDPVRVLLVGVDDPKKATIEDSVEFCGGTHLNHTGEAGFFKIIGQEGVAKGVRRLTATTGKKALEHVQLMNAVVDDLSGRLNCKLEELPARVLQLQDELKKLQTQLKKGVASDLAGVVDKLYDAATQIGGARVIIGEVPASPEEPIRQQLDRLRQKAGSAVVLLAYVEEERVMLYSAVTDDLVKKGLHAGKLMGQVAKVVGGGGGGKPTMAQAGGKEPAKLHEALDLARKLASEQLQT